MIYKLSTIDSINVLIERIKTEYLKFEKRAMIKSGERPFVMIEFGIQRPRKESKETIWNDQGIKKEKLRLPIVKKIKVKHAKQKKNIINWKTGTTLEKKGIDLDNPFEILSIEEEIIHKKIENCEMSFDVVTKINDVRIPSYYDVESESKVRSEVIRQREIIEELNNNLKAKETVIKQLRKEASERKEKEVKEQTTLTKITDVGNVELKYDPNKICPICHWNRSKIHDDRDKLLRLEHLYEQLKRRVARLTFENNQIYSDVTIQRPYILDDDVKENTETFEWDYRKHIILEQDSMVSRFRKEINLLIEQYRIRDSLLVNEISTKSKEMIQTWRTSKDYAPGDSSAEDEYDSEDL